VILCRAAGSSGFLDSVCSNTEGQLKMAIVSCQHRLQHNYGVGKNSHGYLYQFPTVMCLAGLFAEAMGGFVLISAKWQRLVAYMRDCARSESA